MDRCPECEKIDRAAEEAERTARAQAFAEANKWKPPPPPSVSRDGGKTWTRVDEPNRDPVTPEELESRATLPCGCDKPHAEGAQFFVSCIEDSGERRNALLLGPYDTHEDALANVDRGRKLAGDADPKAYWYSFGTCSISEPTDMKGVFGK